MVSRQFLLKAFAALIIIGFLAELLIVYTYTPQGAPPDAPVEQQTLSEQEYASIGLVPFVVASFTGSMLFECNNASVVSEFDGVLGKPVQVGATPRGNLFLARQVNNSFSDQAFLNRFATALRPLCGDVALFREAIVVFNGTNVELAPSSPSVSPSSSSGALPVNLSNAQFSVYRDRLGRGPVALISDVSALPGSVVLLRMRAALIGRAIKPGSLLLEQPALPAARNVEALIEARVLDLREKLAIIDIPWENRTQEFQGDFLRVDEVVVPGVIDVNASFVESAEFVDGNTVLHVGDFADRQAVLEEVGVEGVEFSSSRLFVLYNDSAPETLFNASLLARVAVQPINASLDFSLPQEFLVLAFQNVSVNDEILVEIRAIVQNGELAGLSAVQQGVSNG